MRIVFLAFSHMEYSIELAEAVSELEDVLFMIPKRNINGFGDVINKNVRLYSFHKPRLRYPTNLIMTYKIVRQINSFHPDVIHLQHLPGEEPWFDLVLPFLLRKYPMVITVHDVILHSGDNLSRRLHIFRYMLNRGYSEQFIVHGENLKNEMILHYNVPHRDVHVLPRGTNSIFQRFIEHSAGEENLTILFFGRIWEYKGLRYLIEAEPLITEKIPDAKIIIAGRGEDFYKYREMMVNPEKFIVLNKLIPHKVVADLFQRCSVVVLPYTDASQSGVVPLAYAFKKPVVVTNVGSLPETVVHGETGYIVPPRDSKKLAEAVIALLEDNKKRKIMGENAYKKTQEDLSWKNIAPRTIEVYKWALAIRNSDVNGRKEK